MVTLKSYIPNCGTQFYSATACSGNYRQQKIISLTNSSFVVKYDVSDSTAKWSICVEDYTNDKLGCCGTNTGWTTYYDDDSCTSSLFRWGEINNYYYTGKTLSPEDQKIYDEKMIRDRMQKIIQNRYSPAIIIHNSKRQPLSLPADIREQRARETLKRVVGDIKFSNFLRNGFISVKAKSGLIYQIFPGHGITSIYDQGKMTERLCVVLQGDFPPTDSLIMRYLLILNNEQQFRSLAIKHSVHSQPIAIAKQEVKSLSEIYKDLKKSA